MFVRVVERRPGGVVIRGAKAHQTGCINSHWIVVMPTMRGRRGTGRDGAGLCADDVARAGTGPACARTTSHGPGRGRLYARTTWRSPVSGGRGDAQTGRARSLPGDVTALWLALDSVAPPAGPRTPRLVPRDETVAYVESRPRPGPAGALLAVRTCPSRHATPSLLSFAGCSDMSLLRATPSLLSFAGCSDMSLSVPRHPCCHPLAFRTCPSPCHAILAVIAGCSDMPFLGAMPEPGTAPRGTSRSTHCAPRVGVGPALGRADRSVLARAVVPGFRRAGRPSLAGALSPAQRPCAHRPRPV